MIFSLIIAVLVLAIAYVKYTFTYWDRMGIPTEKPSIPFGNLGPVARMKTTSTLGSRPRASETDLRH